MFFCLYGFTVSNLLVEVVFIGHRKIPFTCSYLPGKGKMHIFWIVYLVSLLSYAAVMSFVAYKLLLNTSGFLYFYAIVFVLFITIRFIQNSLTLPIRRKPP